MAHEGIDDRLQPLNLCVSLALGNRHIGKLEGLLKGERAERFDVLGRSASISMEAMNQDKKAPSTGNLRRNRAASAMHPVPV